MNKTPAVMAMPLFFIAIPPASLFNFQNQISGLEIPGTCGNCRGEQGDAADNYTDE
jgi:hypothetical protein